MFACNDKVYWEFIDLLNDRHQIDRFIKLIYNLFTLFNHFICLFIFFLPSSCSLLLSPLLSPFPAPFFQAPPSLAQSLSQLVDWCVGELVSQSPGVLVGQSVTQRVVNQSVSQSISLSVNHSVSLSVSQSVSQLVNQSVSQSVSQSVCRSVSLQSVSLQGCQPISVSVNPSVCEPVSSQSVCWLFNFRSSILSSTYFIEKHCIKACKSHSCICSLIQGCCALLTGRIEEFPLHLVLMSAVQINSNELRYCE